MVPSQLGLVPNVLKTGPRPLVRSLVFEKSSKTGPDGTAETLFVSQFESEHDCLDVFVANAGISTTKYKATKDGREST
jgi:hypothetical protein